jgi:NAD-dependent epimerase/dehydratase
MRKCILLTGATGFLGSHLLKALVNKGYEVVALKRSTSDTWRLKGFESSFKSYDIDLVPLQKVFEDQYIDTIIHTACLYGRKGEDMRQILEANLMFGIDLLNTGISFNTQTFFNTSSLYATLSKYLNYYTLSKVQFDEWLKMASDKIQVLNMKVELMFGEQDADNKLTSWILSQFKQNKTEVNLTSGMQKRDFIYIDDIVSAYTTCLDNISILKSFNDIDVATGRLTSIRDFIELIKDSYEKITNKKLSTSLNFGALPDREGELMEPKIDIEVLHSLGWRPKRTLEENIERFVRKEINN